MSTGLNPIFLALANQPPEALQAFAAQLNVSVEGNSPQPRNLSTQGATNTSELIPALSATIREVAPLPAVATTKESTPDLDFQDYHETEFLQSQEPESQVDPDLLNDRASQVAETPAPSTVGDDTPAPSTVGDASSDEEKEEGNQRYLTNKSMGVDPFDRIAVQERRRAVRKICIGLGHDLTRTWRAFDTKTWRALVKTVSAKTARQWQWSRETTEKVMKSVAADTVGNERSKIRRARKRNAAKAKAAANSTSVNSAGPTTAAIPAALEVPPMNPPKARQNRKKPGKMTYLRKQPVKSDSSASVSPSTSGSNSASDVPGQPTGSSVLPEPSDAIDARHITDEVGDRGTVRQNPPGTPLTINTQRPGCDEGYASTLTTPIQQDELYNIEPIAFDKVFNTPSVIHKTAGTDTQNHRHEKASVPRSNGINKAYKCPLVIPKRNTQKQGKAVTPLPLTDSQLLPSTLMATFPLPHFDTGYSQRTPQDPIDHDAVYTQQPESFEEVDLDAGYTQPPEAPGTVPNEDCEARRSLYTQDIDLVPPHNSLAKAPAKSGAVETLPKKRGRPVGSKNKPKTANQSTSKGAAAQKTTIRTPRKQLKEARVAECEHLDVDINI
ncbi:hypothetical protein EDC01DRAFT_634432 [Geopyxis carbonaria]|nr:hypothetical protein EDC01DRAFT_634432 [Geopyxis carbonaria]